MDIWLKTGKLSGKKNPEKQSMAISSGEGGASATDVTDEEGRREAQEKRDRVEQNDMGQQSESEGQGGVKGQNEQRDLLSRKDRADECEKKSKKRKYDERYIALGFTWIGDAENPSPQCVLCSEVLANSCLKPSYLRRHLQTKHNNLKDKPVDFFKCKLEELRKNKQLLASHSGFGSNKDALRASYLASYTLAKKGMPHTTAEDVCLPVAKDLVNCMFGEKAAKKLDMIPLSNNTVARRIDSMSSNILCQLVSRVKDSEFFSLQIDESTDIANLANLLVYVRFLYKGTVHEEFLFCRPLATRTTGEDIFNLINNFMKGNGIEWEPCVGISTDGAMSMTGKHKGLVAFIRKIVPSVSWVHCCIHRAALASKNMPAELLSVLNDSVKMVNFIKARPLNSRIFTALCNEMGSEHETLLLHTEVRWLSRGKVLTRLFELRCEVQQFFVDHPFDLSSCLYDEDWLQKLGYLADIFSILNEMNLSLQGVSSTVFNTQDKVEAMIKKLTFWSSCVDSGSLQCFPLLHDFTETSEIVLKECVKGLILEHLKQLSQQLRRYFPSRDPSHTWIRNPFEVSLPITHLSFKEQEQLLELSSDGGLQIQFKQKPLVDFWAQVMEDYADLSKRALRVLMPFATTYLCEAGFSALTAVKTKYRQRMDAEKDLRIKLSSIAPNFADLCAEMQAHPSH